jgi:hypothetical protein
MKEKAAIENQESKIKSHVMYRRPKFLTVLHKIRETMSREADYDVDLFAEMVRSGKRPEYGPERNIRGFRKRAPRSDETDDETPVKERRRLTR